MSDVRQSHAYGVFKPVGHVLVALPTDVEAEYAQAALNAAGFGPDDVAAYTPAQMIAQVDADLAHAGTLAGVGQELNLVIAHRELARRGVHFLLVRSRDQRAADIIAEIAVQCRALRAQRYGNFLIEELIPVGGSDGQVAESTDRGLDAQTVSGREHA